MSKEVSIRGKIEESKGQAATYVVFPSDVESESAESPEGQGGENKCAQGEDHFRLISRSLSGQGFVGKVCEVTGGMFLENRWGCTWPIYPL